jgi:hypothetical protein
VIEGPLCQAWYQRPLPTDCGHGSCDAIIDPPPDALDPDWTPYDLDDTDYEPTRPGNANVD